MTTWSELRSQALVGTARRSVQSPLAVPPYAIGGGEPGDGEPAVLRAAALLAMQRRAGLTARRIADADLAPTAGGSATMAPPEDRPVAPPTAVQVLELLLGGAVGSREQSQSLMVHWLRCCAASGRRLPESLLVRVLTASTGLPALHEPVRAAMGQRGRWLARRNPDWQWAIAAVHGPITIDDWASMGAGQRRAALSQLRAADPAAARELVASTWSSDPAAERVEHLRALAARLGDADEPLLEAALDDRSKAVRAAARELLDGLPRSARAGRMADHLRPLISCRGRLRQKLTVALPGPPDDQGVRDGLGDPPGGRASGTGMLHAVITGAPLAVWTDVADRSPAKLVAMPVQSSDPADADTIGEDVMAAWVVAAARQHNAEWAEALLQHRPEPSLIPVVGLGIAEPLVAHHLGRAVPLPVALELAMALSGPLSPPLSGAVIDRLRREDETGESGVVLLADHHWTQLGERLDFATVADLELLRDQLDDDAHLERRIRALHHHVSTRAAITDAFGLRAGERDVPASPRPSPTHPLDPRP